MTRSTTDKHDVYLFVKLGQGVRGGEIVYSFRIDSELRYTNTVFFVGELNLKFDLSRCYLDYKLEKTLNLAPNLTPQ